MDELSFDGKKTKCIKRQITAYEKALIAQDLSEF